MDTQTPQICRDCQAEFSLTDNELKFYQGVMERDPEFKMPKRCGKCRAIKKKQRALERGEVAHTVRLEPHPQYGMVAKDEHGNGYAFNPKPRREYPKNDTLKKDLDDFVNEI